MKTPIVLTAFLICTHFVSAQLITAQMGASFPTGDYASKDIFNEKGSQAGTGFHAKVSNAFFPTGIVSPNLFVFFNNNTMTSGDLETVYPTLDYIPLSPYSQLGGGFGLTVQTKRKGINIGTAGNIAVANYKTASFVINDMKSTDYVKVKPNNVVGVMFSVGGFVRIPVSEWVTVNVSVDYWTGKVDYGIIEYESEGMRYSSAVGTKIPVQFVTAQLGFSVNLQH